MLPAVRGGLTGSLSCQVTKAGALIKKAGYEWPEKLKPKPNEGEEPLTLESLRYIAPHS